MKRSIIACLVICFCAGFVLMTCNKDKDAPGNSSVTSIHAIVVNGTSFDLDIAKAYLRPEDTDIEYLVGEGVYKNGEFTIQLPDNVPDDYLVGFDFPEWANSSDKNINGGIILLEGYKSDEYVDNFNYGKFDLSSITIKATVGLYTYVDKDVKISGKHSEKNELGINTTLSYNVSLKKGWNIMFVSLNFSIAALSIDLTTSNPGGMKWYFANDDFDFDFNFGF